jgi:hypothetical protein
LFLFPTNSDEDDAEKKCEELVKLAMTASDGQNAEVYQCGANLRFIQQNLTESKALMKKAVEMYHSAAEQADKNKTLSKVISNENNSNLATKHDDDDDEEDLEEQLYTQEIRTAGAKLCMELELYTEATDLLERSRPLLPCSSFSSFLPFFLLCFLLLFSSPAFFLFLLKRTQTARRRRPLCGTVVSAGPLLSANQELRSFCRTRGNRSQGLFRSSLSCLAFSFLGHPVPCCLSAFVFAFAVL